MYTNPESAASFSNPHVIQKSLTADQKKEIGSKNNITKALQANETYTTTRKANWKFKRQKVISPSLNYVWDCDSSYMTEYNEGNEPYIGFVVAIDIHSRFLRTCLIKSVSSEQIVGCFSKWFKSAKPLHVRHDFGSEFIAKKTQDFLKANNVKSYSTRNSTIKSNYAERVILTVKRRLARYMDFYNTRVWTTVLEKITKSYNSTFHRSIQMRPDQVDRSHEEKIWTLNYISPYLNNKIKPPFNTKYRFKIGDVISISILRSKFHRGWHQNFTNELFIIVSRYKKEGIPLYRIKDLKNRVIDGVFYQQEIQKSLIDYDSYSFKIDKILKKRGKYSLVSWKGWPSAFNSYVLTSTLQDI